MNLKISKIIKAHLQVNKKINKKINKKTNKMIVEKQTKMKILWLKGLPLIKIELEEIQEVEQKEKIEIFLHS